MKTVYRIVRSKVFLAALSALVLLVLAETGIRLYVREPRSDWAYRMRSVHRRFQISIFDHLLHIHYPPSTRITQKVSLAPHPQKRDGYAYPVVLKKCPNRSMIYRTNAMGFRDDEFPADKKTSFRIVCIGDSVTWGDGVPLAQTYSKVLQRRLKDSHGDRYQVINAGSQGMTSLVSLFAIKEKIVPLEPDIIVFCICVNDDVPNEISDYDYLIKVMNRTSLVRFLDRFYVYIVLKRWLDGLGVLSSTKTARGDGQNEALAGESGAGEAMKESKNRVPAKLRSYIFNSLIAFCRSKGIRLVIMSPPMSSFGPREEIGPPVRSIIETARQQGVPVIDLFEIIPALERENGLAVRQEGVVQHLVKFENGRETVLLKRKRPSDSAISPGIYKFIYKNKLSQRTVIDQLHPTVAGHEIIADLIYEKLIASKLLEK